jgi:hypothetical protein
MARAAVRFRPGTVVTIGIAAGFVFAAFEVLTAGMLTGVASATRPLRMIAAMVLGPAALSPAYSLAVAGTIGLGLHLVLSIVYTAILAIVVSWVSSMSHEELLSSTLGDTFTGVFFGIALYVFNYFVVSPLAGWSWFHESTLVEFFSHALFGGVAGWMLARSRFDRTGATF